jgi:hypothetical protein
MIMKTSTIILVMLSVPIIAHAILWVIIGMLILMAYIRRKIR